MRLLIFGGGDLAQRVVALLPIVSTVREVVIVTRDPMRGEPLAQLFSGCARIPVRHAFFDKNDLNSITTILRRERPDCIFQATSIISPWVFHGRDTPVSRAFRSAGFGVMLPAQLHVIRQVMLAVRDLGLECPVVNASYPDLTHPVLATEGLAPMIGVGNVGMLFNILNSVRRSEGVLRLFAHHAQITPFAERRSYLAGVEPWLFIDECASPLEPTIERALPTGQLLNALTANHTIEIIAALLGEGAVLHTSAPGPLGLPGGWPVRITPNHVELDLPAVVSTESGLAYQAQAALGDGVAGIDPDGTIHYTVAAKASLAATAPHLTEPLRRYELATRLDQLIEQIAP